MTKILLWIWAIVIVVSIFFIESTKLVLWYALMLPYYILSVYLLTRAVDRVSRSNRSFDWVIRKTNHIVIVLISIQMICCMLTAAVLLILPDDQYVIGWVTAFVWLVLIAISIAELQIRDRLMCVSLVSYVPYVVSGGILMLYV